MGQTRACLKADGSADYELTGRYSGEKRKHLQCSFTEGMRGRTQETVFAHTAEGNHFCCIRGGENQYLSLLVSLHRTDSRFVACCIEILIPQINQRCSFPKIR